jgi:hypothetical protein
MEIDHFPSRHQRLLLEANPTLCRVGAAASSNRDAGVLRVHNQARPTREWMCPGDVSLAANHYHSVVIHKPTNTLIQH